ncbi:hypothetical protein chiPu_0000874 [Chiloscyllium punctatum]|uniref:Uncharacterized protein n=1 Tax=Chiloscyllium punctatum TaxID=137246 RepID=A0A401RWG2_CHIPU|nr:hypothetical protein [Chiloscyllium punctatum]
MRARPGARAHDARGRPDDSARPSPWRCDRCSSPTVSLRLHVPWSDDRKLFPRMHGANGGREEPSLKDVRAQQGLGKNPLKMHELNRKWGGKKPSLRMY